MTNQIPGLEQFYALNNALLGAPVGVLVLVACIALGYVLKLSPWPPNEFIPIVVVLAGCAIYPLLSERGEDPLRIWITTHILRGLISACIAWAVHNRILKPIETKLGWFNEPEKTES